MPFRHRHLLFCALPQLHESRGEAEKLLASRRETRTALVSNEQRPPELLLKEAHTSTDCRLCDMQPVGSFDEAAGGDDLYEGFGELDIHVFMA